jgi:hypothetical protein
LANLIILLKLDYYDKNMIREFNYFIKIRWLLKLWSTNLNILLKLDYYYVTIVGKFNYFIKVRLLWQNYDLRI